MPDIKDIAGQGSECRRFRYQLYYSKSGDALFNGFETITCDKNNKQVLLTVKHDGKCKNETALSEFAVVDSSRDNN